MEDFCKTAFGENNNPIRWLTTTFTLGRLCHCLIYVNAAVWSGHQSCWPIKFYCLCVGPPASHPNAEGDYLQGLHCNEHTTSTREYVLRTAVNPIWWDSHPVGLPRLPFTESRLSPTNILFSAAASFGALLRSRSASPHSLDFVEVNWMHFTYMETLPPDQNRCDNTRPSCVSQCVHQFSGRICKEKPHQIRYRYVCAEGYNFPGTCAATPRLPNQLIWLGGLGILKPPPTLAAASPGRFDNRYLRWTHSKQ